jgi:hypothetical protein
MSSFAAALAKPFTPWSIGRPRRSTHPKPPVPRRPAAPPGARGAPDPAATGSQLLALVPQTARPWVQYSSRSTAPQQARQQVATGLAAGYLTLLTRELGLRPAERAKQVRVGRSIRRWWF